jgi:hypothetical protein
MLSKAGGVPQSSEHWHDDSTNEQAPSPHTGGGPQSISHTDVSSKSSQSSFPQQ